MVPPSLSTGCWLDIVYDALLLGWYDLFGVADCLDFLSSLRHILLTIAPIFISSILLHVTSRRNLLLPYIPK